MEARPLNSLTQRRADSKAKSLSTGTIRAGTEVAYCPMGAARIYEFPSDSLRVCTEETARIRGERVTFIITLGLSFHTAADRNTSALWKVNTNTRGDGR